MKKVLITRKLIEENFIDIQSKFHVIHNQSDKNLSDNEIIKMSLDCDGILTFPNNNFHADLLNKLSDSIKIIANYAVGFGNIDIDTANKKKILVTNTPEVLTEATAEVSILLLLGASRRAYEGRIFAENKNWEWSSDFLIGKQMTNKKLGILGMGRIGRAVADIARGFGMEIHYHNRSRLPENLEKGAIFHEQLKDLLSQSEFLSINCPGGKDNTNLLNKETLKYLPDGAVVANAARGEIINDKDMLDAIRIGKVFALGLDVYNGEPQINEEYLKLKNLFLLPHLGSATKKTRIAMGERAINNLDQFLNNSIKPNDQVN